MWSLRGMMDQKLYQSSYGDQADLVDESHTGRMVVLLESASYGNVNYLFSHVYKAV